MDLDRLAADRVFWREFLRLYTEESRGRALGLVSKKFREEEAAIGEGEGPP